MDATDVSPNNATPPDVEPSAGAPAPAAPKLPPDLMKNPAFQGLLAGKPGAVSANIKDFSKRAEAHDLVQHKEILQKAGMAFYRSIDGHTGVVFNQMYIHPEELKQADVAGQLAQVAPPFDSVSHAISKSGLSHPLLTAQPPTGFKGAPPVQVPQAINAPMPSPPASVQKKVATAQLSNMQPGSPTSGPSPGAGRLLNSILKPVI